jgi:amidase
MFAEACGECDVLLAASATGEAPLGLTSTGNAAPSTIWTALHVPSITIPVFKGPAGLPVGAQLIGRRNDDRKLLAAARWAYQRLA